MILCLEDRYEYHSYQTVCFSNHLTGICVGVKNVPVVSPRLTNRITLSRHLETHLTRSAIQCTPHSLGLTLLRYVKGG